MSYASTHQVATFTILFEITCIINQIEIEKQLALASIDPPTRLLYSGGVTP